MWNSCTLCFLQTNYLLEYHGNLEEHCWYDNVSQAEVKVAIIQFSAGGSTIASCRYSIWGCGGWLDGRVIVFIMGKFLIRALPRFSTVTLDKLLNSWILALLICKERNTIPILNEDMCNTLAGSQFVALWIRMAP